MRDHLRQPGVILEIREGERLFASHPSGIPKDVQDSTLKADVIAGTVFPFTGPIKNQKGDIVVKDGEKPNETTLQAMDYLIEGVVGTLP